MTIIVASNTPSRRASFVVATPEAACLWLLSLFSWRLNGCCFSYENNLKRLAIDYHIERPCRMMRLLAMTIL
jgi:hypothetical protein